MANGNLDLDFITQLSQFKEEHGFDITKFESFDPKFTIKLMQTAHKVMRDKVVAGERKLISIPVVTTVGTTKKTVLFTNNIAFSEDVEILCSLFVRGQLKKNVNYYSGIK